MTAAVELRGAELGICSMGSKKAKQATIRDADELIDEAAKRLADIDRALEALKRRSRRWSTPSVRKELREHTDYVRAQRTLAQLELLELIELAELPVELMGSA